MVDIQDIRSKSKRYRLGVHGTKQFYQLELCIPENFNFIFFYPPQKVKYGQLYSGAKKFRFVRGVTLRGHMVNLKQYRDDQQFPCIRMNRFTKRFNLFFCNFHIHQVQLVN